MNELFHNFQPYTLCIVVWLRVTIEKVSALLSDIFFMFLKSGSENEAKTILRYVYCIDYTLARAYTTNQQWVYLLYFMNAQILIKFTKTPFELTIKHSTSTILHIMLLQFVCLGFFNVFIENSLSLERKTVSIVLRRWWRFFLLLQWFNIGKMICDDYKSSCKKKLMFFFRKLLIFCIHAVIRMKFKTTESNTLDF